MTVNGMVSIFIIEDPEEIEKQESPAGKAFLRAKFHDGTVVDMSLTLAELLGAVAMGTSKRLGYAPKDN